MTRPSLPSAAVPEYRLTSDLAQFCLPAASSDVHRNYAWATSLCVGFLIVGLIGMRARPMAVREAEVETVVVPVVFIPADRAPAVVSQVAGGIAEPATTPLMEVKSPVLPEVVALDASALAFPVPIEELATFTPAARNPVPVAPTKITPTALAQTRVTSAVPAAVIGNPDASPKPVLFGAASEDRGRFPVPPYPEEALRRGFRGKVMLYVLVRADGSLERVEVKDGCGFAILDHHSVNWVRKNWRFPSGDVRHYHVPFIYQITGGGR